MNASRRIDERSATCERCRRLLQNEQIVKTMKSESIAPLVRCTGSGAATGSNAAMSRASARP